MPKNATDELFVLIKSLGKAEKAFFKKNAATRNSSAKPIYIQLFDAIDRQEEFDEKLLLKKIAAIRPERLSDQKNFLYNLLLSSLEQFHQSANSELLSKLHHIEILYEKGLYKQCRKLLAKAKQTAAKTENQLMSLLIIHWEKKIHTAEFNTAYLKHSDKVLEEEKLLLNQYENLCEYEEIDSQMTLMIRRGKSTLQRKKIKEFGKVVKNRLLADESKTLSVNARIAYHRIFSLYYYSQGMLDKYEEECERVIELLESKPDLVNQMQGFYARSVYNLLLAHINRGDTGKINHNLRKIKTLKARSDEVRLRQFTAINFELSILFTNNEFDKVMNLVDEAEMRFRSLGDKINHDDATVFNYQLARIYTIYANYNKASIYLNRILNASKTDTEYPEDIYCFAHLLRIIVHFELGNTSIIGHLVKSASRFLQKRRKLYVFEKCILNFFRKNATGKKIAKELPAAFKQLKLELEEILHSPLESKATDYFDFIAWVDSKIEKKPLLQVNKLRAK